MILLVNSYPSNTGVGKPVLVIPWMVMQELDFLKVLHLT